MADHLEIVADPDLSEWTALVDRVHAATEPVDVAVVGKYVYLRDAYLSVMEALRHGGSITDTMSRSIGSRRTISAATRPKRRCGPMDGILIPGGFGVRGVEGKVDAARVRPRAAGAVPRDLPRAAVRRDRDRPQHLRSRRSQLQRVRSGDPAPVIDLLPEQKDVTDLGATMRLGAQPCYLEPGTRAAAAYEADVVEERHRHRYEVNPAYHEALTSGGLVDQRVIAEGPARGDRGAPPITRSSSRVNSTQSCDRRPTRPHPLFRDFVGAAAAYRGDRIRAGDRIVVTG